MQTIEGNINNNISLAIDKNNFNSLIAQVKEEIGFNILSGVGSKHCPFKIFAHEKLLLHEQITEEARHMFRKICQGAELCNGGVINSLIKPGLIKGLEKQLLNILKMY